MPSTSKLRSVAETPCSPFSLASGTALHVFYCKHRSRPSVRTTSDRQHLKRCFTVTADPRVVNCNRLGHRQVIHILLHRRNKSHKDCTWLHLGSGACSILSQHPLYPSQYAFAQSRCFVDSVQRSPVMPARRAY